MYKNYLKNYKKNYRLLDEQSVVPASLDVICTRRRLTSQVRRLEFTVLRRHDISIRRRGDHGMTS